MDPSAPLPYAPSPLIGRAREVEALAADLIKPEVRLITVTGPGGVGKTRLAVSAAREAARSFKDGVAFVDLSPVNDPDAVTQAIARALGIVGRPDESSAISLHEALVGRELLLVLDNFEQVTPAATDVAELLGTCPHVTVLVTSRAVLRLRWELVFPLAPLGASDLLSEPDVERLLTYPATALFVERARAADSAFALAASNAAAVAELCRRLDGLPLALELAAAHARVFTPEALVSLLRHRAPLPGGAPRDLPGRQQSLRDTIAWSYNLLTPGEQRLLRRLAVLAGGWTLEAAQAVAEDFPEPIAELLDALEGKSLVRRMAARSGAPYRFTMLETIREFALDALAASGEQDAADRQHSEHFIALAEAAEVELEGPRPNAWLDRLERERENLWKALRWLTRSGRAVDAWRLVGALDRFWHLRGHASETRHYLTLALAARPDPAGDNAAVDDWTTARAKALYAVAVVGFYQGSTDEARRALDELLPLLEGKTDPASLARRAEALSLAGRCASRAGELATARQHFERSYRIWQAQGRVREAARVLAAFGLLVARQGDRATARAALQQSMETMHALGDTLALNPLRDLAQMAYDEGDLATARACAQDVLEKARIYRNVRLVCASLTLLGRICLADGKTEEAVPLLDECLALARAGERSEQLSGALDTMGEVALARQDFGEARRLLSEGLRLRLATRQFRTVPWNLSRFAALAAAEGAPERALRLAAASLALHASIGVQPGPARVARLERQLAPARAALGRAAQEAAWKSGATLSLQAACAEALCESRLFEDLSAITPPLSEPDPRETDDRQAAPRTLVHEAEPESLTARERQVAVLVSRGLTNREISEALVITEGTARIHVANVMGKLGFRRRAEVASWAVRRGLAQEETQAVAIA